MPTRHVHPKLLNDLRGLLQHIFIFCRKRAIEFVVHVQRELVSKKFLGVGFAVIYTRAYAVELHGRCEPIEKSYIGPADHITLIEFTLCVIEFTDVFPELALEL